MRWVALGYLYYVPNVLCVQAHNGRLDEKMSHKYNIIIIITYIGIDNNVRPHLPTTRSIIYKKIYYIILYVQKCRTINVIYLVWTIMKNKNNIYIIIICYSKNVCGT